MTVVLLLFYGSGLVVLWKWCCCSMEMVLLSFNASGSVGVLCQWSDCRSMRAGQMLFYVSGPVVVLWQWSCCCSMNVVLFLFYDSGPSFVL